MSYLRSLTAAAAALALTSCSYHYPVEAAFVDGALTFLGSKNVACNLSFIVVGSNGETVWEFHTNDEGRHPERCSRKFPLRYGQASPNGDVQAPAKKLRLGYVYVVTGSADSGMIEGAFVLYRGGGTLAIRNLPEDSEAVEAVKARSNNFLQL